MQGIGNPLKSPFPFVGSHTLVNVLHLVRAAIVATNLGGIKGSRNLGIAIGLHIDLGILRGTGITGPADIHLVGMETRGGHYPRGAYGFGIDKSTINKGGAVVLPRITKASRGLQLNGVAVTVLDVVGTRGSNISRTIVIGKVGKIAIAATTGSASVNQAQMKYTRGIVNLGYGTGHNRRYRSSMGTHGMGCSKIIVEFIQIPPIAAGIHTGSGYFSKPRVGYGIIGACYGDKKVIDMGLLGHDIQKKAFRGRTLKTHLRGTRTTFNGRQYGCTHFTTKAGHMIHQKRLSIS